MSVEKEGLALATGIGQVVGVGGGVEEVPPPPPQAQRKANGMDSSAVRMELQMGPGSRMDRTDAWSRPRLLDL
jgi:hypothetical protein